MTIEHPELSISICTLNRKQQLAECLELYSRQKISRGTFEIVVTDRGSTDGTREMLESLHLGIPVRILHANGEGHTATLNANVNACCGRIILFAADDSIPRPGCLEAHLQAHASVGRTGPVVVAGPYGQCEESLRTALGRYIESRSENGQGHLAHAVNSDSMSLFNTRNASVRSEDIRRVGGFDPTFVRGQGGEADLGRRLEKSGLRFIHVPDARTEGSAPQLFDEYMAEQRMTARANVLLYRKHPELIEDENLKALTFSECHTQAHELHGEHLALENAARELSRIDLRALEPLGDMSKSAQEVVALELAQIMDRLQEYWTLVGYLDGFRDCHLAGFHELGSGVSAGDPFETEADHRLLAWPKWDDDEQLDRLMERIQSVAMDGFATLILRHDPAQDPELHIAQKALEAAYQRRYATNAESALEVLIETETPDREGLLGWGRAVDALLLLGTEPDEFLRAIGGEHFSTSADVIGWRSRFEMTTV